MTKEKTKKLATTLQPVDEQIKKQVDKVYTDLVILAEILANDGTKSFVINLHFAKIEFTFRKETKND